MTRKERIRRIVLAVLALHIMPGTCVIMCFVHPIGMPVGMAYLLGWVANGFGMAGVLQLIEWVYPESR